VGPLPGANGGGGLGGLRSGAPRGAGGGGSAGAVGGGAAGGGGGGGGAAAAAPAGRRNVGSHFNDVYEYVCDTGVWRRLAVDDTREDVLPARRRHASAVVVSGRLFIYGGFDAYDHVLGDVWEFHLSTRRWSRFAAASPRGQSAPSPRAEHTAVLSGDKMVVFGGYDGKRKLNDTLVLSFVTKEWSRPPQSDGLLPSRRCKHTAVVHGGVMYVVGGFQFHNGNNYAATDVHALDLTTYVWSTQAYTGDSPDALQGHKAAVVGDSMVIFGGKVRGDPALSTEGRSSALNTEVYQYRFAACKWFVVPVGGVSPAPRQLHSVVSVSEADGRFSLYVFGGSDRTKSRFYADLSELRGLRVFSRKRARPAAFFTLPGGARSVAGRLVAGGAGATGGAGGVGAASLLPPDWVGADDEEGDDLACRVCADTATLLGNPLFSDVAFEVEGRTIPAHRCVLYVRGDYFRRMFSSRMREGSAAVIPVPGVTYAVFYAVLSYLYSGCVVLEDGELALEVLKAADMFRLDGLRAACVERLEVSMRVDNAATICQVADTHNAAGLKIYCITFIVQHFKEVIGTAAFQDLMRADPSGLGLEILNAFSDNPPTAKRMRMS